MALKQLWRELALAAAGLVAAAIGFAIGAIWGWRVLGVVLMLMAAWVYFTGQAAFILPGLKPGYLTGKNAVASAIVSAAIGFALIVNAGSLTQGTHRACESLHLAACQGDPVCVNDQVVSVPSPARNIRAVRFVRTCGTGTASSTNVSIVSMGDSLPEEPGNAFIVDGKVDLVMLWIEGRHLAISGGGATSPRLQKAQVNGVRISYDGKPR